MVFLGGVVFLTIEAFEHGDFDYLLKGADSFGNVCGKTNQKRIDSVNAGLDMSDRKFVYYSRPDRGSKGFNICVSSCPGTTDTVAGVAFPAAQGLIYCNRNTIMFGDGEKICRGFGVCIEPPYTVTETMERIGDVLDNGCPEFVYQTITVPFVYRCIPDIAATSEQAQDIMAGYYNDELGSGDWINQALRDIEQQRNKIIIILAGCVVISFLVVISMRFCAMGIVYGFMAACFIGIVVLAAYLGYLFHEQYTEFYGTSIDTPPQASISHQPV